MGIFIISSALFLLGMVLFIYLFILFIFFFWWGGRAEHCLVDHWVTTFFWVMSLFFLWGLPLTSTHIHPHSCLSAETPEYLRETQLTQENHNRQRQKCRPRQPCKCQCKPESQVFTNSRKHN